MCGIQDVKQAKADPVAWKVLAECTCAQATTVRNSMIAATVVGVTVANGVCLHAPIDDQLMCLGSCLGLAGALSWWKRSTVAYSLAIALGVTDIVCRVAVTPGVNAIVWLVLWTALLITPRQRSEQVEAHTHDGETHAHHHLHVHHHIEHEVIDDQKYVETTLAPQGRPIGELTSRQITDRLKASFIDSKIEQRQRR